MKLTNGNTKNTIVNFPLCVQGHPLISGLTHSEKQTMSFYNDSFILWTLSILDINIYGVILIFMVVIIYLEMLL